MCGISGIINFDGQPVDQSSINKMMVAMKHRGPDDQGIFLDKNIGLGFVRLSIIDLSENGHQPMQNLSGQYLIIYNGEVYNFIEIRKELNESKIKKKHRDSKDSRNSYNSNSSNSSTI